jgi:hypothetical protein
MFDSYKNEEDYKEQNGYTIDGVWYPRVTRIVGIKAKPALYRFYGEAPSFKAAQESTENSAKEGTMVHEAVESYLLGRAPQVDPLIAPAFKGFLDFIERRNIQTAPDWVERRIKHEDHRYAGTIDAMALIDGKFGVLDIKTSQAIYRDYNLQTSAYMEALAKDFPNLETRWILRIDQNQVCPVCGATRRNKGGREKIKRGRKNPCGTHEWGPMQGLVELQEFPYWRNDFEAFLGAKRLWEWENEEWLKRVGYI